MFNLAFLDNPLILKHLFTMLSWERLMIGVRSFYKNDHSWTDYRLVLPDLKFVDLEFFVTVDNNVSCYVTLGDLKRWSHGEKRSVTHQCSISSEKTKVTQFSRFCRFMTYSLTSSELAKVILCMIRLIIIVSVENLYPFSVMLVFLWGN